MTAIEQLVEGFPDDTGYCQQCENHGACRDWVICMAEDAEVPVEWLAQQILNEVFTNKTSIIEIQETWKETRYQKGKTHDHSTS